MIRAAAKNHAHVGVVTDPADYDEVLDELRGRRRAVRRPAPAPGPQGLRLHRRLRRRHRRLVRRAGRRARGPRPCTSPTGASRSRCATARTRTRRRRCYRAGGADPWWAHVEVSTAGMALSYLNLFDADAAWLLAHDLRAATGRPAVAIIKHANPCGAAVADDAGRGLPAGLRLRPPLGVRRHRRPVRPGRRGHRRGAWSPPPRPTSSSPPATADGVDRRAARPSARTPACSRRRRPRPTPRHLRPITGGLLVQDPHRFVARPGRLAGRHRARSPPTPSGPTPSWPGGSAAT